MREALRTQHIEPALRNVYHNIRDPECKEADVVIIVYRMRWRKQGSVT